MSTSNGATNPNHSDEVELTSDAEHQKHLYEAFVSERRELNRILLELASRYDKAVLVLSGGALALSVTFVEKIAPNPIPWTTTLLVGSWIFLLGSVIAQLLALNSSERATRRQIDILDLDYAPLLFGEGEEANRQKDRSNPYRKDIGYWNILALSALILGMILLFIFAGYNTVTKFKGNEQRSSQKTPAGITTNSSPGDVARDKGNVRAP